MPLTDGLSPNVNCDMGSLGGLRGTRSPKKRGIAFKEVLDKYNHFACNMDPSATGPIDTYFGPTGTSTIDYICVPRIPTKLYSGCSVHYDDPLNTFSQE